MKRNIPLLYAMGFLQGMVFYASVATLYRQAAGLSVFQITLIESLSLALSLLLELPWGIIADRMGYRRTMILCSWVYFLSKLVFWQADSFPDFLLERLLLALALSGYSGVDTGLLYLSCGKEESQRVFGWYEAAQTGGLLAASGLYALLPAGSFRLAGLLTALSYGAAALCSLFLREAVPEEEQERVTLSSSLSLLRDWLKQPRLLLLVLSIALLNETHQTITVFLAQLRYIAAGMTPQAIALVYILMTLLGLLSPLSHPLTHSLEQKRAGTLLFSLSAVCCLILMLTESPLLSVTAVLGLRLGFSLFQPLQNELQNRAVSSAQRASALSLNSACMSMAAIGTNLSFGRAAECSFSLAMALGLLLSLAGLFCYRKSLIE